MRARLWIFILLIAAVLLPSHSVFAGPAPTGLPMVTLPRVFCFRITDIEKVPGDPTGNAFNFEFEVLNWTNSQASGLSLMTAVGSTAVAGTIPTITDAAIDADGRGGPYQVGAEIGFGAFDSPAIQSGRGRGDQLPGLPNLINDWFAIETTATTAAWFAGEGHPIPARDLLGAMTTAEAIALIPGLGLDALGDLAVDGGPAPYSPAAPPAGGGPPFPDGTGNVLDGFVLTVTDFHEGEILSLNWFLTNAAGGPIGVPITPATAFNPGAFGFGVFNLMRLPLGAPPFGRAIYVGNSGMVGTATEFVQVPLPVNMVLDPAQFVAEFGAGITAPFLNPQDNIFGVVPNTTTIPEPSTLVLLGTGVIALMQYRRRRRHPPE